MSRHLAATTRHGPRSDIQLLRAFAVAAVVVYHFWPTRLAGGFIGVDVFFVISGYLICGQLLAELGRTGSIALLPFWARRAKRLLPAACTVILVTAGATLVFLPRPQWVETFRQLAASAIYLQNWLLARDSVDYLAAENDPTAVQHFWSLSVEEQFYIAVPVILLVLASLARSKRRARMVPLALGVLAAISLASFAYSAMATAATPGPAYFSTLTRAWEFGAGGLAAAVTTSWLRAARSRIAVTGLGLAGLVASLVLITPESPFPGTIAALPVVATVLVLVARPIVSDPSRSSAMLRAGTAIGDRSYSIYLWHWPVLIFAHSALGEEINWSVKLLLLVGIAVLAEFSFRFVENPLRRRRVSTGRGAMTIVASALALTLVVAVPLQTTALGLQQANASELRAAQDRAAAQDRCFGAPALQHPSDCADENGHDLTPSPAAAADDLPAAYANGCHAPTTGSDARVCHLGDGPRRVALIGDSHAVSWQPTFAAVADELGWTVDTYTKAACPLTTATTTNGNAEVRASCSDWRIAMREKLAAAAPYDFVFMTASTTAARFHDTASAVDGYRAVWAPLVERGAEIVVIRDVPRAPSDALDCLARTPQTPSACSLPRDSAFPSPDLLAEAAGGQQHVRVIDFTDAICDSGWCYTAIGGVTVFRDEHHLTETFARTLAPELLQRIRPLT